MVDGGCRCVVCINGCGVAAGEFIYRPLQCRVVPSGEAGVFDTHQAFIDTHFHPDASAWHEQSGEQPDHRNNGEDEHSPAAGVLLNLQ